MISSADTDKIIPALVKALGAMEDITKSRKAEIPTKTGGKYNSRAERFLALADLEEDSCIEWPYGRTGAGYGAVSFYGRRYYVHRLALQLRTAPSSPSHMALHGPCHHRSCMNYRHLRWGTNAENQADRERDQTSNRGERHPLAKLSASDVRDIRTAYASGGVTQRDLADLHHVARETISYVVSRGGWAT